MTTSIARVGELADQLRGVTYKKAEVSKSPRPGYIPLLRANNIESNGIAYRDLVFVPDSKVKNVQILKKGDVLVAASSGSLRSIGKAAQITEDWHGTFGAFCKVLRPGSAVDQRYFGHFFRTQSYRREVSFRAEGLNINNLKSAHLSDLEMPIPPLGKQRRTARSLDLADALLAKRKAILAHLRSLERSLYHAMFTCQEVHHRWQRVSLADVVETTSGGTPDRSVAENYGGAVPWVKSGELRDRTISTSEETITHRGLAASSAKVMPAGTILLAMYGATVGAMATLGIEAATNQAVCCITPGPDLEPAYLYMTLQQMKPELLRRRAGGAQPNLSQELIRSTSIWLPPIELQQKYAERSKAIARQEHRHRADLDLLTGLFAALQARAFKR